MYAIIYRMQFTNLEGMPVIIHVSDTTSGTTGSPLFKDLQLESLEKKIVSDGDSKYGIKSTRLVFSFLSTPLTSMKTFMDGADNKWLVEMFFTDTTQLKFSGYLVNDDLKEKYLTPETYTVELSAADGLGLLRSQAYTKPDGTNPRGYFKWIDYISAALQKTNLQLPIKVVYSLFPEGYSGPSTHTFQIAELQAKTFESAINESEDCFTVLEKILKGCLLVQYEGAWWILRVDEINTSFYTYYIYDYLGAFSSASTVTMEKLIGLTEVIQITGEGADVIPERTNEHVKETFKFEFPQELIDNYDFSRGTTWLSPIVVNMGLYIKSYANLGVFPTVGEFDATYKANDTGLYYKWTGSYVNITGAEIPVGKAYIFEDWTLKKGNPDSPVTPTTTDYVAKISQYGDEKERYVVLTNPTVASTTRSYAESNPLPVGRQDKFSCSVDFRFPTDITSGGAPFYVIMAVRLKGEDGSNWWLGKEVIAGNITPEKWYHSGSDWSAFSFNPGPAIPLQFNGTIDVTQWQTVSWDAPPVPVNGDLYIQLCAMNAQSNTLDTWDDTDIHYANLQFNYIPFTNGSYQKYTGQSYKVSQPENLRANIEEILPTADTTKKIFKGAIFKNVSGAHIPTTLWYNYNAGTTGELGLAPFGKYQAFAEWNQRNRVIRRIETSLLKYNIVFGLPSPLHRYRFTETSPHSDNKYYMLLSCSQNLVTCEWSGVFAEVYDSLIGKVYDSDYEFKYLI